MRRIIFTNAAGDSILLGNSTPYMITKLEGTGAVQSNIQMLKSPFQDGATFIGTTLEHREITIEAAIVPKEDVAERRRKLIQILNPKLGTGILRHENEAGTLDIKAIADQSPVFPDRQQKGIYQRFLINFVCPDPAWYDPKKERIKLASFVGGFNFPFRFPINFGRVGQFLKIQNKGDLDTPVFITFAGPLRNPVLENRTIGKKIIIKQDIPEGERLEINTAFGQKSVVRIQANGNRSNAFHWVSPESQFWQLIPGVNEISYASTEEAENAAVTLEFFHRYLGV
ncbi:phage tail family protein [Paenibacillus sp. RC84]|uniref:phage tail family protein n=1 Tax=Paenibacillus sp. RC84 TaxID=3156252 RepID=UPI0035164CDD